MKFMTISFFPGKRFTLYQTEPYCQRSKFPNEVDNQQFNNVQGGYEQTQKKFNKR